MKKNSIWDFDKQSKKTPIRLTKFNMKMKRIDDLHTHKKQDLLNKLFKYISSSRNFLIEVHHALFLDKNCNLK